MRIRREGASYLAALAGAAILAACGGGDGDVTPPPAGELYVVDYAGGGIHRITGK
jgi:hypothetical protein